MTTTATAERAPSDVWLPALLLLFFGSGCAALIYEIVWFQLLELSVGSSAVSLGILLGTFMGGLCLGSLLLPRLVSARRHPMRVYALLELAIGLYGILLLWILPLVGRVYTSWGGYGFRGLLLRGLAAGLCLLPPTFAMGATLPVVARSVERTPAGVAWLGFLYAGNLAGGVLGCLLAGFYLLRVYDMATATVVAASVNGLIAVIAFALVAVMPSTHQPSDELRIVPGSGEGRETAPPVAIVYVAMAISGFCALAAEVIWTRILGLLLGPTVYTFSIILAVFLIGLGLGSGVGSMLAQSTARPRRALGWCQLLLVGAIAWTAYMTSSALPYWPIVPSVAPHVLYNFQLDLARTLFAILPATVLWGACFPLALASVRAGTEQDQARLVGAVYAANTVGAILGALGTSLLFVAAFGSQRAQQGIMSLSAWAGALLLVEHRAGPPNTAKLTIGGVLRPIVILGVAGWLVMTVAPIPGVLVAYGKHAANWIGRTGDLLYVGEGLNSFVAVSRLSGGVLAYHNAGKIQASSQPQDMRLQRLLGHASTLIPGSPGTVLVIGCGSGVTAGAVSLDPKVGRETIVEIERLVPRVVSTYFRLLNFDVVNNPKVQIQIDDARHYLLTTDRRFDVITSDPFDPWVRGAAVLYTKEFLEAARAHLNRGGIVTMWVPLYTTRLDAVKSQVATFFSVFPAGFVLGNTYRMKGNDIVLVGQRDFTPVNLDEIDSRLQQPDYAQVTRSLGEVGFPSAAQLFSGYAGRAADLRPWLADATLNRDGSLRLQYLAGLGLNTSQPDVIYDQILRYRRSPEDVFTGSPQSLDRLRASIEQAGTAKP